ncbi:extracellular catalytic domain type 1 short-chain-length polyhydroxyalkanoate depolymerase [Sphingomonas immobilis]|uniref:PHB depolymerase family esterase n=1 Tax=Sphingomonas immobilis TaxID=3063997 RepID=A0ABT8ZWJ4_9SPHN|nr:PHB depolymerase family esterase [Sphingomonas sp. CA1-15]MDO7841949.1 PHB depolymerase family esterase [Sphingomonas sp. CA1-15]
MELVAQKGSAAARVTPPLENRLETFPEFGPDPGALRAWKYIPNGLLPQAPLVVVLHGCTQGAASYDDGSGWSRLADTCGFALLYPEQQAANNPQRCFNWFAPDDIRRGQGEASSIRHMITAMIATYDLDPARVYITGLSAGGAMTSVMLATYPETFAAGAIIAGLAYGSATGVADALARMRGQGFPAEAALVDLVRNAAPAPVRFPSISIWHGAADTVVVPENAKRLTAQWRGVHGLSSAPARSDTFSGSMRQSWTDPSGTTRIESFLVPGMGHGVPLATRGAEACGVPGPFMLEAGISSTREIARFFGLLSQTPMSAAPPAASVGRTPVSYETPAVDVSAAPPKPGKGISDVIEDALRAAGLMR